MISDVIIDAHFDDDVVLVDNIVVINYVSHDRIVRFIDEWLKQLPSGRRVITPWGLFHEVFIDLNFDVDESGLSRTI